MTARDEAERAIADVLVGHEIATRSMGHLNVGCLCGWTTAYETGEFGWDVHRAHVASLLADLMAERQAEALEDAADAIEAEPIVGRFTYPELVRVKAAALVRARAATYRPDPKDTRDEY